MWKHRKGISLSKYKTGKFCTAPWELNCVFFFSRTIHNKIPNKMLSPNMWSRAAKFITGEQFLSSAQYQICFNTGSNEQDVTHVWKLTAPPSPPMREDFSERNPPSPLVSLKGTTSGFSVNLDVCTVWDVWHISQLKTWRFDIELTTKLL